MKKIIAILVFMVGVGKYKGRINNWLTARGYDLKSERDGWNQRIEAAKKQK